MKAKINSIYFQAFLTTILVISLIVGIFFFFKQTQIKVEEYLKEKNDFYNLQNKIFLLQKKNQKENLLDNKNLAKVNDIFFEIKKDEIKNEKIGNFLEEIENLGKNQNIVLKTKNITEPKGNDNFYLFEFEIEGEFPNFLKFLFNLENTPTKQYYLIEVSKINLSRQVSGSCEAENNQQECEEKSAKTQIKGSFELRLYTRPKIQDNQQNQGNNNLNLSSSP